MYYVFDLRTGFILPYVFDRLTHNIFADTFLVMIDHRGGIHNTPDGYALFVTENILLQFSLEHRRNTSMERRSGFQRMAA